MESVSRLIRNTVCSHRSLATKGEGASVSPIEIGMLAGGVTRAPLLAAGHALGAQAGLRSGRPQTPASLRSETTGDPNGGCQAGRNGCMQREHRARAAIFSFMRLNFGCGSIQPEGWENVDKEDFGQSVICDAFNGLPYADCCFELVVSDHALQIVPYDQLAGVLAELYRVLEPNGVIRIMVPDPLQAYNAYVRSDVGWFPVNGQEPTLDDKFCVYLNWFSTAQSFFTAPRLCDLLKRAGFRDPIRMAWGVGVGKEMDTREAEKPIIVTALR